MYVCRTSSNLSPKLISITYYTILDQIYLAETNLNTVYK